VRFLRSKRGKIVLGGVLVLGLFVTRPGAQSLRTRLAHSIGLALGRQVEIGEVSLRLLPQPGFDLRNFVVHDDPEFSAEPVLRADEVTATLRASSFLHPRSLLRGQFEIARLNLSEPSFNLVRNADGHWNVENLLERAAKNPVAPTAKPKGEARPAFPYIEADQARINFKFGQEKKPYALTNAEVALWQDSENTWGIRLKAQPVRTDFNLSDLGLLRMEGAWQRAASLPATPMRFSLRWDRAQLGQATKLAFGRDKGWRGEISIFAMLAGTPEDLAVAADASVEDFRRADISGATALRLAAHCDARYRSMDRLVSGLACQVPVGAGDVTINGKLAARPGFPAYDLALAARHVPMQSLISLARHTKKNLPGDLTAAGKLDASVRLMKGPDVAGGQPVWQGGGETTGFRLSSNSTRTELVLDRLPFSVSSAGNEKTRADGQRRGHGEVKPEDQIRLEVGPFGVALGRPAPSKMQGWISHSGYDFSISGEAEVQKLLAVARMAGLAVPSLTADGQTRIDLKISGAWTGFVAPKITGDAQLHSVRAEVRGLNAPVEITSASILLAPDEIRVKDLNAAAAGSTWRGSMLLTRPCATLSSCPIRFDLHTPQIATDQLSQLFNPHPSERPWYRFLSPVRQPGNSSFLSMHAAGTFSADQVVIRQLTARRVSAMVELEHGRLHLSSLRGEVLGGQHRGEWTADFTGSTPVYRGTGVLEQAELGQLAAAMHDDWVTGTASANYRATVSGVTAAELLSSANANLLVEARNGSLPHLALAAGNGALHMNHFAGRLLLRDRQIEIDAGKLATPGGIYQVSGTVSLGRVLDLKLLREGAHSFNVTGTLAAPLVLYTPETRAALKP
jgi:hypothetical protein